MLSAVSLGNSLASALSGEEPSLASLRGLSAAHSTAETYMVAPAVFSSTTQAPLALASFISLV